MDADHSILLLMRHAPLSSALPREMLDVIRVALVFEYSVSIIFADDGVWQIVQDASSSTNCQRDHAQAIAELLTDGDCMLYACDKALAARGLGPADLLPGVTLLDKAAQHEMIARHSSVLGD